MAREGQEGREKSRIVTQAKTTASKFICNARKGKLNSTKEMK